MAVALHVYVYVEDLEAGIRFYADGLGLTLRRRLAPNWVELEGAAVPLFLLQRKLGHRDTGAQAQRNYERHWTPVHSTSSPRTSRRRSRAPRRPARGATATSSSRRGAGWPA